MCVAGIPNRSGLIRSIERTLGDGREFEVEITGWKQARPTDPDFPGLLAAHDLAHEGTEVTFLNTSGSSLADRKRFLVWERQGPGVWLTHREASPPSVGQPDSADVLAEVEALRADR